jgi:hypothetical protein
MAGNIDCSGVSNDQAQTNDVKEPQRLLARPLAASDVRRFQYSIAVCIGRPWQAIRLVPQAIHLF